MQHKNFSAPSRSPSMKHLELTLQCGSARLVYDFVGAGQELRYPDLSVMIVTPFNDGDGAKDLLQQKKAGHLMCKGHG